MRLKKGFTLAEILIVLVTIGVIATLTIPSMMKGVQDSQFKTAYKKAYNSISNIAAMEQVTGNWISTNSDESKGRLYEILFKGLNVKAIMINPLNSGVASDNSNDNFVQCLSYTQASLSGGEDRTVTFGLDDTDTTNCGNLDEAISAWLVTEDNLAYTISTANPGTNATCQNKQRITAQANDEDAHNASCFAIFVDVNGVSKAPNLIETQGVTTVSVPTGGQSYNGSDLNSGQTLSDLTGDQYKIYVGRDGVTAGPRTTTVTGRIAADLK